MGVIDEAVAAIRERTSLVPRAMVVLGSGLGGFAAVVEDAIEIPYGEIAAASVVVTLPVVALAFAFQRRLVDGLTAGAVKG